MWNPTYTVVPAFNFIPSDIHHTNARSLKFSSRLDSKNTILNNNGDNEEAEDILATV
jgi:hypothetical protein